MMLLHVGDVMVVIGHPDNAAHYGQRLPDPVTDRIWRGM